MNIWSNLPFYRGGFPAPCLFLCWVQPVPGCPGAPGFWTTGPSLPSEGGAEEAFRPQGHFAARGCALGPYLWQVDPDTGTA